VINVRGIANAAIQPVNPNISDVPYRASTGFTTTPAGKQVPTYAAAVPVTIQAQAASTSDLKQVANLNITNIYRNVRMWGNTQGVVRPDAKGGDLLTFPQVPGGAPQVWLVVKVLETWPTWCSCIVCLQTDAVT
jgi:hypothetical protein